MSRNGNFRPMLACDAEWSDYERIFSDPHIEFLLTSPKLDGIRATVRDGQLVSRSLKLIRNEYIQSILGNPLFEGMDGELTVGPAYGEGVFARASSGVMSFAGQPDFTYHIFDDWQLGALLTPFCERSTFLKEAMPKLKGPAADHIRLLPQSQARSIKDLEQHETEAVQQGYEGLIVRHPLSPYKYGRSTLRERFMMKLKRFHDSEARIIGFQELFHNDNDPVIDHLGLQRRSAHQDNKIPGNKLGALIVQDLLQPAWEFNVGTGFDDTLRHYIWDNQSQFMNRLIKYKYLQVGIKDLPRHPVFLGFREAEDTSNA